MDGLKDMQLAIGGVTVILGGCLAFAMLRSSGDSEVPKSKSSAEVEGVEAIQEDKYPGGVLEVYFGSQVRAQIDRFPLSFVGTPR